MKSKQVKLWFYLKENDRATFEKVKSLMPKPLIRAYDAEVKLVASSEDIKEINNSIHKLSSDVLDGSNKNDVSDLKLPPSILREPDAVLAYYLLVLPSRLSKQLEMLLPMEQKHRVIAAMDEISPQRMPKPYLLRLMTWISEFEPTNDVRNITHKQKAFMLEQLVDDTSVVESPLVTAMLNPKVDFFLFTKNDQRQIIQTLLEKQALIPFLVFFDTKTQVDFLNTVSKRQQRILLDTLALENKASYNQTVARNTVIDVIRDLQKQSIIDAGIKGFND
ncbi:MAG: hypothetical protein VXX85_06145 [Candidatus Margulisiibacteriota bacterium]|nr:hypothetical protein [Candidatus Margulisiibacteriota bacterium]